MKRAANCVHPDDEGAGRTATEECLARGHRRIAYLDYCHAARKPEQHYSAADRRIGYERSMRAAGLQPRVIACQDQPTSYVWLPAVNAWLSADDRPTAAVGYSGREASTVLYAAALLGLSVPNDLSIVAIDDDPVDTCGVTMSTVLLPRFDLGLIAVELLLERIASPTRTLPARILPVRWLPGRSITAR